MNEYRSEEINQIAGALAKAQGSYQVLKPNQMYKGEKYANLDAILAAVREALSANGIYFYQYDELMDMGTGPTILKTMLIHESGQWISSWARIISERSAKESAMIKEFIARQQALKILGIAPTINDPYLFDDNGEQQSESVIIDEIKKPKDVRMVESEFEGKRSKTINNHQYNELIIELEGYDRIARSIMHKHGIDTLADLPESVYHTAMGEIRRIKKVEENERRK